MRVVIWLNDRRNNFYDVIIQHHDNTQVELDIQNTIHIFFPCIA